MDNSRISLIIAGSPMLIHDKKNLHRSLKSLARGAWQDFKTTNQSTATKALKVGAGLIVGGAVARPFQTLTPVQWAMRGFGPLPMEMSGAIQVFEFSAVERAILVAKTAGAKFVLVTAAFEAGIAIGSVANQFLSEETKDDIGGTINEIVNENGWKCLWQCPFGYRLHVSGHKL
jgi:hypothetical protein